uniref:Uncharacterized protein n=1 Tax=Fagus sylvatica TaxID=28930 RepID=A0A2N9GHD0_FAGSY
MNDTHPNPIPSEARPTPPSNDVKGAFLKSNHFLPFFGPHFKNSSCLSFASLCSGEIIPLWGPLWKKRSELIEMDKRLQGVLTSGYGFQLLSHKVECQSPRPILEWEANSLREIEVPLRVPSLLETGCPQPLYLLALATRSGMTLFMHGGRRSELLLAHSRAHIPEGRTLPSRKESTTAELSLAQNCLATQIQGEGSPGHSPAIN